MILKYHRSLAISKSLELIFALILLFLFYISLPNFGQKFVIKTIPSYFPINDAVGEFSNRCYLLSNPDVQLNYAEDEAWIHYESYGYHEGRPLGITTSAFPDFCFVGYFDYLTYNKLHGLHLMGEGPLSHYLAFGHAHNYEVALTSFYKVHMMQDFDLLGQKYIPSSKSFLLIMSHSWGGGTELFEEEMKLELQRVFNIFIMRLSNSHDAMSCSFHVNNMDFHIKSSLTQVISFLKELHYDVLLVDFLHPLPPLLNFLMTVNKPIVYVLHDHHVLNERLPLVSSDKFTSSLLLLIFLLVLFLLLDFPCRP